MISIIVPVFNEEKHIKNTLQELKNTLQQLGDHEIIVVNDGSTDNTQQIIEKINGIDIISYCRNRGKGYALRKGIAQSKGQIIGFIDGDGEISPRLISRLYEEIRKGKADVVVGKKQNLKKNMIRKLYSVGFRALCLVLFGLNIDTQTGLKLFKRKIKSIYVQNDSYLFDLELIIACKEKKMSIKEIPIQLSTVQKRSRIGVGQVMHMLAALINIKLGRQTCTNQQSCGYYLS